MRNLSINLTSPDFEEHVSAFRSSVAFWHQLHDCVWTEDRPTAFLNFFFFFTYRLKHCYLVQDIVLFYTLSCWTRNYNLHCQDIVLVKVLFGYIVPCNSKLLWFIPYYYSYPVQRRLLSSYEIDADKENSGAVNKIPPWVLMWQCWTIAGKINFAGL